MRPSYIPLLLLVLLFSSSGYAYELFMCGDVPCTWNKWPVSYYINAKGTEDMEDEFDVIQQSFARWEAGHQTFCGIQFDYRGTTNINISDADGYNTILWIEDEDKWEYSSSALALTQCWFDDSGSFHDCDIMVNGVDFEWTDGETGGRNVFDLRSTLTHEIGHFWGLDHSELKAATMYEYYNASANAADLDYDDILGGRDVFCPEFDLPEDDLWEDNDTYIKAADLEAGEVIEPLQLYDDDWFELDAPIGKRVKVFVRDEDSQRPKTIYLADVSGEIIDSGVCFGDCNVALGDTVEADAEDFMGNGDEKATRYIAIRGEFDENPIDTTRYALKVEFVNPGEEGELFDDDDQEAEGEEFCGCDPTGAYGGTTNTFPPAGTAGMIILLIALTQILRFRAARR